MSLVLRGGTVVNADRAFRADVLVEGETVRAVAADLDPPGGATVVDAGGCFVIPGGIDPHTHFQLPMMGTTVADDFLTGTIAAAAGGTTTILDFVGPERGASLLDALTRWQGWASRAVVDYGLHMTVSWWGDQVKREMEALVRDHGVASFKMFTAYKGHLMLRDDALIELLTRCGELGAVPMVHAENGDVIAHLQAELLANGVTGPEGHPQSRPSSCEGEATTRVLMLAETLNLPLYVVHVSCAEAAAAIADARGRGVRAVGETLPGFLAIDDGVYFSEDWDRAAGHVMSPPYRPKGHQEALWRAVQAGTLSTTGTDHCCFTRAQKRRGLGDFTRIPNGCGGVEDRLHVLWHLGVNSGRLTPSEFVALTSANAARVFGLYPRKGVIAPGADADIAIIDPMRRHTLSAATQHQNTDFSVWEGMEVQGRVVHTVARGDSVWVDGDVRATPGRGRYVPRRPFGPLYEGLDKRAGLRSPRDVGRRSG